MASKKTEKKSKSWNEAMGDGSFAEMLRKSRIEKPPSEKIVWVANDKGRTFVWKWEAVPGEVIVTRHIGYEPDEWVFHCFALGFKEQLLGTKNIEEAKHEALWSWLTTSRSSWSSTTASCPWSSDVKHTGRRQYRFKDNPEEERFAKAWDEHNSHGSTLARLLDARLAQTDPPPEPDAKEVAAAATVIQWLGSPVGQHFLSELGYTKRAGGRHGEF